MTLLFITQKFHTQDAFTILWIRAFMAKGYRVVVLCLEGSDYPNDLEVYSMGKEKGYGKLKCILRFWKLIMSLRYDRVFIHMSPVWGGLGAWWWIPTGKPVYLWYTHYKMQWGLRLLGWYAKRLFCATAQSLPQYEGSKKKIVTGHGIDLSFWFQRENHTTNPFELLVVHRLCRSKRLEINIRALALLPSRYTMVVYGIEAEPDYVAELRQLVRDLHLQDRVIFKGTAPMEALPDIYTAHHLILNMASETIDKTMLEAMTCGCYPVTTKRNALAIGISYAPEEDTPEAVAAFVQKYADQSLLSTEILFQIVAEKHSLESLIDQIDAYMKQGD